MTLKVLKGKEYGELDGLNETNSRIMVNLTNLYKAVKRKKNWEDQFIKDFAQTYCHELLHELIDDMLFEIRLMKEEEFIRKMNKERWSKVEVKFYEKEKRRIG